MDLSAKLLHPLLISKVTAKNFYFHSTKPDEKNRSRSKPQPYAVYLRKIEFYPLPL